MNNRIKPRSGFVMKPLGYSERVHLLQSALGMGYVDGLLGPNTAAHLKSCIAPIRGKWARPMRWFRRWYLATYDAH